LFKIKRVYDAPSSSDVFRVLVDRLWPRGMSKEKAKLDLWLKEVGPSNELRQWFSHEPDRWAEFKEKYEQELVEKQGLLAQLRLLEKEHGTVTLIYAARDLERNNAVVLQAALVQQPKKQPSAF
jgi:uncharacterized protein YeaO (DUF488 family)